MNEPGSALVTEREERGQFPRQLEEIGVDIVDLVFSDITGGAKTLTIPASQLGETMQSGYRFDGSAVMGGDRTVEIDLLLKPDPETVIVLPEDTSHVRRARVSCGIERRNGEPFDGDPRSALQRVVANAESLGIDYQVGIEIEYYLVRGDLTEPVPALDAAGYFDVGDDEIAGIRDAVVMSLQAAGIATGGGHHETGPGQEELDLLPAPALRMADNLITVRHLVRMVAQRYGLRATFMPKIFSDAPGSGMHVFQQFKNRATGKDLLSDGQDSLSRFAYHAIAGQLAHAIGMTAVLNPTVNSYKRLNAGHRAPRHATWAHVSQEAMIRVPSWGRDEPAALELRLPDAMANPYLAFAVALAAAIDGIQSESMPPEPLEESFSRYDDGEYQRFGVPRLPGTLGEALHSVTQDVAVTRALGEYIADRLVAVKQDEWEDYRAYVGPWEHSRYGDA